ncbi:MULTISPECIES: class I adenylate-forming enzyme family protein [Pseudoalteromonas]|uniref:AMP-dependent synthetase/ligase domain-containing protein n=1 Tax=Pseudoalteromonas amylolytica TaxID=1859457 RepID=A0A1S1MSB0_9GAMM|nr:MULTISPECIES: class I adenylate-forming enzyme family protein [Pseudoalteromonas]OHU86154.1 hypothetical protein BFC16_15705 [Pseudoalteromonas sp. JW3]OHU89739.1 hypothetical protein BET10_16610 [Pseudoalteromonas amylolytica]
MQANFDIQALLSKIEASDTFNIVDDEVALTGRDFCLLVAQKCDELSAMGLGNNDTVLVQLKNSVEHVAALCALWKVGVFTAIVKNAVKASYINKLIEKFHFNFFLSESTMVNAIGKNSNGEVIDSNLQGFAGIRFNVNHNALSSLKQVADLGIFSSGTTGEPKLILHKLDRVLHNSWLHTKSVDMRCSDRVAIVLPIFYSFGLIANLFGAIQSQSTIVMCKNSNQIMGKLGEWLQENAITFASVTPHIVKLLIAQRPALNIRTLTIGGDAINKATLLRVLKLFDKTEIYCTYGLTEAGPRVSTYKANAQHLINLTKVPLGEPLDGVSLSLANEVDGVGELVIETPTKMVGIAVNNSIVELHLDHRLNTGDFFSRLNGGFAFSSRSKNIIKRAGEKIYPSEIENVISEFTQSEYVRVTAQQDPILGEVPVAYIEAATPFEVTELKRYIRSQLPSSCIPTEFNIVERLPEPLLDKSL